MPLRWISRMFRPKNAEEAALLKLRFSMVYAFVAWNFFAVALYTIYRENIPANKDEQRETLLTKLSRNKDVRYMKVNQMTVVEEKMIPKSEESVLRKPEQEEDA